MLFAVFTVIFLLVCIALIFLVLIQSDKGGGLAGSIGGGLAGAGNVLGTQDTANILTRGTTIFAGLFMVLCIVLSLVFSRNVGQQQQSELKKRAEQQGDFSPASALGGGLPVQNAPAAPAAPLPAAPAK